MEQRSVSDLRSPLAIQDMLHSFPHLDRQIVETLLIMHKRGRLSELCDTSQVQASMHDNLQEDQFIKRDAIIVTENIST